MHIIMRKLMIRIIKAPPKPFLQAQKKTTLQVRKPLWPTIISLGPPRTHSCHLSCPATSRLRLLCLQLLFSSLPKLTTSSLRPSILIMAAFMATVRCQTVTRATFRTKCLFKATPMANTRPSYAKTGLRQLSVAMRTSAFSPMDRRS